MPELPEVETTCRGIGPSMVGHTIIRCDVYQSRLRLPVPEFLNEKLAYKVILSIKRRAKYILIQLNDGYLIIHLGMSGHLRILPQPQEPRKHDHIDIGFNNGKVLRYNDPRRFGLWQYIESCPTQHPLLRHLGPEPLTEDFNADYLFEHCRRRKSAIKNILMDNTIVVGIGNIYASESLYLAGIHPERSGQSLSQADCEKLVSGVQLVLSKAIDAGGTSLKDFLNADGKPGYFSVSLAVYGRGGQACSQCETAILACKIAGRNSFYCPQCQY